MKFILILLVLLLTGCASYTPGEDAEILQNDSSEILNASAQVDSRMSFKDLMLVNFYFSNPTKNWMRIKNVEITNIENHSDARVIVGKDLYYWAKSMEHKIAIDNHNRELFWGSLAMAGAAISVSSNSTTTSGIGAALAIGSITVGTAEELLAKVTSLERASLVPESHLYSPFSIPPHLVSTKWILLQKMNIQELCRLKFKVTFIDGTSALFNSELTSLRTMCGRVKNE